ncbi:MAG: DUF3078 domain-containing protein [Candidatus Kapabacteria bacterium]|nr:DUF3078 domain-containing protein [Candidatus Kapabacteria bacterium]
MSAFSADPPKIGWTTAGTVGMNFTQVGLSNWAGGGQNTIGLTSLFSATANFNGEQSLWENSLDLGYGLTKLGDQSFRKSDDRIILISKYGYKVNEQLSYAALLDFRTQFHYGYTYNTDGTIKDTISNLLAPANMQLGLGVTYKPTDFLTITIAPIANRLLIVGDVALRDKPSAPNSTTGFLGNEIGKTIRSDLGAQMNITFKKDLMTNVNLASTFTSFAPYATITENFVNWNTLLTLKVNDYINASIAVDVVYDPKLQVRRDDGTRGPATQVRNVLGIGFGYKF